MAVLRSRWRQGVVGACQAAHPANLGQAEHGVPTTGIAAEGGQGCRVESPQGAGQDIGLPLAGPDQYGALD
jgi:hypothetical protein